MLQAFSFALLVGGATMLGGALGFFIPQRNGRSAPLIFSFAGGVMTCAALIDLIFPAMKSVGALSVLVGASCVLLGGGLIRLLSLLLPQNTGCSDALLFVSAIALHNFPEGLAVGAALATGNVAAAVSTAVGIAVQNVPEGLIVVSPLTQAGMKRWKAVLVAMLTGVVEIAGTFLGYFASSLSNALLPFILCLTGGAMLWIVASDVLPETGKRPALCFSFLFGAAFSAVLTVLI